MLFSNETEKRWRSAASGVLGDVILNASKNFERFLFHVESDRPHALPLQIPVVLFCYRMQAKLNWYSKKL